MNAISNTSYALQRQSITSVIMKATPERTVSVVRYLLWVEKPMRLLNIVLFALMFLFAAVQYNDPDGPMWMVIYAIPALWSAIAVFKRPWLVNRLGHALLLFCIFAAIAGTVYYWPTTPGWWQQEIWWNVETAREGIGMMIVSFVLIVAWLSRPRASQLSQTT